LGAEYFISQTENGWQTQDSFFKYVTTEFVDQLDRLGVIRRADHPFFYFLDGHVSHVNYQLFKWCHEHHIIIILFFPNATHILQMADVAMFGPGKSAMAKEVQKWKATAENKTLNHCDFVKLLKIVTDRVMTSKAIQNGFKNTGIWPLNEENLQTDRCIGADKTNGEKILNL
jgi:hypothetical protein